MNILPDIMTGFDWAMLGVAAVLFALFLHIYNRLPRLKDSPASMRVALSVLSVWAVAFGGSKGGRVVVDDPYIKDDGSWLSTSNNVAHVAIAKKSILMPNDTEILVYAREVAQTNAADWVRLTPHLTFADHPHDYLERRQTIETGKPIRIGDDCWLGGGVIVCPGVTIGNRVIVGAGSVVTHDIPDDVVVAGNPAKIIKTIEQK